MREIDAFIERIAPSFEDAVVAYAPALLPVYLVRVELLVRTRTEVGAAELALLQSIQAGLTSPDEVEGFLGLDSRFFRHLILSLERQAMLIEIGQPARLLLSDRGRLAVEEGQMDDETIEELRIHFDPLLRKVFVPSPRPVHPSEVGPMVLLGERQAVPPEDAELEPAEIQSALGATGLRREWSGRQMLRVTSVLEKKIRLQQVVAIVVRNSVSSALSLRLVVGNQLMEERSGALSRQHDPRLEVCFAQCNDGREQERFESMLQRILPTAHAGATKRIKKELINAKVRRSPVTRQYEQSPTPEHLRALERIDVEIAEIEAQAAIAPDLVQTGIAVHRLIERAFVEAKSHILIVVPGQIVEFPPEYLRQALAATTRGVSVTIAHGRGAAGAEEPAVKVAAVNLKKEARTVYWETIDTAEPLFTISWDARSVLLVSRPTFATVGNLQELVPIYCAYAEDQAIVRHLFFGSSLDHWAMTARRLKSTKATHLQSRKAVKRKKTGPEQAKQESRKQHRNRRSNRRITK